MNTSGVEQSVTFRFVLEGQVVSSRPVRIGAGMRFVRFMHDIFPEINFFLDVLPDGKTATNATVSVTADIPQNQPSAFHLLAVKVVNVLIATDPPTVLPLADVPHPIHLNR